MSAENKETTVLGSSVGADAGQPSKAYTTMYSPIITTISSECNEDLCDDQEFMRRLQRAQDPTFLNTVSYNDLMDQVFPYRKEIVEGLLSTGAYILAGPPKIGKSFFVAQLAYYVSKGIDLWDYKVHPGTVLYLALEDDKKRLQDRMSRMFGVEGSNNLHFATDAGQLGKSLEKQLENFMLEHPDTVLMIVDTLQKIREVAGDSYSYASDYEAIGKLKEFADSHNICIVIVHHTRKQPAGDTFEMISGTTGLLGCADGALLMKKEKRTDSTATLELVSRDHPDQKLYLEKNQQTLVWELEHAEKELWKEPADPLLEKISELVNIEAPYWEGPPTELAAVLQTDIAPNHLSRHLNVNSGRLYSEYNIGYSKAKKHAARVIQLTYIGKGTIENG